MKKQMLGAAMVIGLALVVSAGCSSSADQDPTPVTKFKITPASGSPSAAATATPAAQATPPATPEGTAAGATEITITSANATLKFDKNKLTASAGTVTVTFDNQDSGIPHNIDFFEGKDASGKSVGKTDIAAGPIKQKLTIDLKAGTYYYQCDVHPATMSGTLTVS